MSDKGARDVDDVYSLRDLLKDPPLHEVMLGRVVAILSAQGEGLAPDLQQWKARVVFQWSNVRAKTGTSAAELFEEVANAPASFAVARAALAAGVVTGFDATLRDAEAAYLQSLIDAVSRLPIFVELPTARWPDSRCLDPKTREKPWCVWPRCRLIRALRGHPEAGAFWEAKLGSMFVDLGWNVAGKEHPGVYVHKDTGAALIAHVDDLRMRPPPPSPKSTRKPWKDLEGRVRVKELEAAISR